jgi:hypothetical protein
LTRLSSSYKDPFSYIGPNRTIFLVSVFNAITLAKFIGSSDWGVAQRCPHTNPLFTNKPTNVSASLDSFKWGRGEEGKGQEWKGGERRGELKKV